MTPSSATATPAAADLGRRRRRVLRPGASTSRRPRAGTFELGGPDAVTWNELYDRMQSACSACGARRPRAVRARRAPAPLDASGSRRAGHARPADDARRRRQRLRQRTGPRDLRRRPRPARRADPARGLMPIEHDSIGETASGGPCVRMTTFEGPPAGVQRVLTLIADHILPTQRRQPGWRGLVGLASPTGIAASRSASGTASPTSWRAERAPATSAPGPAPSASRSPSRTARDCLPRDAGDAVEYGHLGRPGETKSNRSDTRRSGAARRLRSRRSLRRQRAHARP